MTELTVQLPDDLLARIHAEANRLKVPAEAVVSTVLAQHFAADEDDEPTKAEILDSIRESVRAALAGDTRPVDDVIAELKKEFDFDAD